uniref:Endonuclease/exonuclease/phosphatase family protein n=1 Tax=uncultured bacterium contig00087 TaxID=1181560 RepID=A0A806KRZ6_9BACT|nr:predicted protein [uncultured bacterium contig00087]
MKIVSWNCRGGFDGDKPKIINESFNDADILVIPECRKMDMDVKIEGYSNDKEHRDWYGDGKEVVKDEAGNPNKIYNRGIGIFCKKGITIKQNEKWDKELRDNNDYRYLVPYNVSSEKFGAFTLIAVWTKGRLKGVKEDKFEYVEKIHAAIDKYKKIGLLDDRVILIGDFNSNKVWDKEYNKELNHSKLVCKLENEYGIIEYSESNKENYSTYHYYHKEEKEVIDDYCFASKNIAKSAEFTVPASSEWDKGENIKLWKGLSDHCPICVEFTL